jgi:hypothetical protein
MALIQCGDAFEFYKDEAIHQQIRDILANDTPFISDDHRLLLRNGQAGLPNLDCKGVLIDLLEKAIAERVANLVGASNDSLG